MPDTAQPSMHADAFFGLVDQVLIEARRLPLKVGSPERAIISIQPTDQVCQILAGPSSGKTEMLVWRVLYELFVLGTSPSRLIVTTFTRKAATDLEVRLVERCERLIHFAHDAGIPTGAIHIHDVRIGTLHSLCDSLLAEFDDVYMTSGTELIDDAEVLVRLSRDHRFTLGFSGAGAPRACNRLVDNGALVSLFRPPWLTATWPAKTIQRVTLLRELIVQHTETWIPRCSQENIPNGIEATHGPPTLTEDLAKIQERWETYLDHHSVLDFSTIQKRFAERQHLLRGRFSHVFVDEFQDNNPIQFRIHTNWLAAPGARLTVVGDDDQAMYRFRGSDIACFKDLQPYSEESGHAYRQLLLEVNRRSTRNIVEFGQAFKVASALPATSLPKHVTPDPAAAQGVAVRLLEGPWEALCQLAATEVQTDYGGTAGGTRALDIAFLMFSTSERDTQNRTKPATTLRSALESVDLRVYNPRNKIAGEPESPLGMLFGLISYLIDPISEAAVGKKGRAVMVWASHREVANAASALSAPPGYFISETHASYQKKFRNNGGRGITGTPPERVTILRYLDRVRDELVAAGPHVRLSLAGLVARLLSLQFFRSSGFTTQMFRQALFTQLLEANTAPTRRTLHPLDGPMAVSRRPDGKYVWPDQFWQYLNVFGSVLENAPLDDLEVEAFEQGAVPLLTFHQAKGLEFETVYVASTGREPDLAPALRTQVFSGRPVAFTFPNGVPITNDPTIVTLAAGDRDREVYVALTRAKTRLTILADPAGELEQRLHPSIASLFENSPRRKVAGTADVHIREWPNA